MSVQQFLSSSKDLQSVTAELKSLEVNALAMESSSSKSNRTASVRQVVPRASASLNQNSGLKLEAFDSESVSRVNPFKTDAHHLAESEKYNNVSARLLYNGSSGNKESNADQESSNALTIQETIDSFFYLEKNLDCKDAPHILWDTLVLIWDTFVIVVPSLATKFQTTLGFIVLNSFNRNASQQIFSYYIMIRSLVFTSFDNALSQALVVSASQSYGEGNLAIGKKYLTQCFIIKGLFLLFLQIPFIFVSPYMLEAMGFNHDMSLEFYALALKLLPCEILDWLNRIFSNYCYGQKIEKEFAVWVWPTLTISTAVMFILSFTFELAFNGWIISRTVMELLNFLTTLTIYYVRIDPVSLGFSSINEACVGLMDMTCHTLSFWIGNLFEWTGSQLGLIFTLMIHDSSQMAAYGSMMNIVYFFFDIGHGFLVVGRTRINYLLGAGYQRAAKKLSAMILLASIMICLMIGAMLLGFREQIADKYASHDPVEKGYLLTLILLYGIFMQADCPGKVINGIMRTINHVYFSAVMYGLLVITIGSAACWYMRSHMDVDCTAIFTCMYTCMTAAVFLNALKMFCYDWKDVKLISSRITNST